MQDVITNYREFEKSHAESSQYLDNFKGDLINKRITFDSPEFNERLTIANELIAKTHQLLRKIEIIPLTKLSEQIHGYFE